MRAADKPLIFLRQASLADVGAITDLIDASIRVIGGRFYNAEQVESSLRYLFGADTRMIDDGGYFVAVDGTRVIGAGGWSWRKTPFGGDQASEVRDPGLRDPDVDPAVIRAFYVHPDFARQGIGRRLLDACESAARENGFRRFELVATLSGISFYESMGYMRKDPISIRLADNQILEALHMTKET